ncbi:unnamed protein product [Peniophora sp. CBMAI 1063]|nr:unnamed protein product [Peniophora sp. CBMAI 1063]
MPIEPGAAAFRFHKSNVAGFFVFYYGVLAHPDIDRNAANLQVHTNPITSELILAEAEIIRANVKDLYLEAYCRNLPECRRGGVTDTVVDSTAAFLESDLGPILYSRNLFVFGPTEEVRSRRLTVARATVERDSEKDAQLNALVEILRLGRENPSCPGISHITFYDPNQ